MNNTTRKSFIKALFATTALTASSAAFSLPSENVHVIRDDLYYRPDWEWSKGYSKNIDGAKLREVYLTAFKHGIEEGNSVEEIIRNTVADGGITFDGYTSAHSEKQGAIDRFTTTEAWLRRFCADNGIR